MTELEPEQAGTSAREEIGRALDGKMTPAQVKILINEVLAIKKRMWGEVTCKACGQRQKAPVDVPDAKAVASALTSLLDQAWGRPSEVKTQDAGLVVNRNVYVVEEMV